MVIEALVLAGLLCAAVAVALILRRRARRRGSLKLPDRFDTLALRAGGKVVAERLVAGEMARGAETRAQAIDKALDRLDRDRRSWR